MSKIVLSVTDAESVKEKFVFLDNDFLSEIFRNEDLLKETLLFLKDSFLSIDPLTEFEFLRNIFVPELRDVAEAFVSKEVFCPVASHQEIFLKIQENALLLSKIYSHNNQGKGCSLVDLFLAARLMLNSPSAILITGNAKDFPSCLFDMVGAINTRQKGDDGIRIFSLLKFNVDNFKTLHAKLESLEIKPSDAPMEGE